ncbi:2',5' RNA ligase family [Pigmentiphaga humi]|uniref:RNA 2',3'-cyclic phosphodiesterase n=1 Tax=Pigmentiphaga humi TaxID=2478468 RepID=A0A3P4B4A9_9BURK|nr:RNA 2',3'-cyclic phosphodiesterase [Pigmentiphaga humi]VCU71137.1 2',5' RNA ligase family [Pigmentiphaga humi]
MPAAPLCHPRSFIALAPDAASRARLAEAGTALPPARLLAADLHLTIAFLGALEARQAAALQAALQPLARAIPDLEAAGLTLWPHAARARVAVATFGLPDALRQMVAQTQAVLRAMDLPVEDRPYRPHVTLARFGAGKPAPRALPEIALPPMRFETLGLYCSAGPGAGTRYRALFRLPLA